MKPRLLDVTRSDNGLTLIEFLSARLRLSKKAAKRLLDQRSVFVNRRRTWMAKHRLQAGDVVEAHEKAARESGRNDIPILHQDEHLLVVNKPDGMLSNGPDSIESILREQMRQPALMAVHRLDRDTSGCLVLAKTKDLFQAMVTLFRTRQVSKSYRALAAGKISPAAREISTPLDGQSALTRLTVLRSNRVASWLDVSIETGRTHQIRRHLALIRHPLLGDKQYAGAEIQDPIFRAVRRQMLHASSIQFPHPVTGEVLHVTAPLPGDIRTCLKSLGLD